MMPIIIVWISSRLFQHTEGFEKANSYSDTYMPSLLWVIVICIQAGWEPSEGCTASVRDKWVHLMLLIRFIMKMNSSWDAAEWFNLPRRQARRTLSHFWFSAGCDDWVEECHCMQNSPPPKTKLQTNKYTCSSVRASIFTTWWVTLLSPSNDSWAEMLTWKGSVPGCIRVDLAIITLRPERQL